MATEKLILEILKLHKIIRVFISLFVMIGLFFTKSMMPNVEILHLGVKVVVYLLFVYFGYIIFKYNIIKKLIRYFQYNYCYWAE